MPPLRRPGKRHGLPLLALALGIALLWSLLVASSASAYTYVLRPNSTVDQGSWTIIPSGAAHAVLDDAVLQPALPLTALDYVEHIGNGPVPVEVGLTEVTLRAGETVTLTRSWGYARTGDARTLDTELRTGATVLASGAWASGLPAQWQPLQSAAALTQAEVDDLRQRRVLQGSGASTPTTIYASYVELHTDLAAPAPTITSAPPAYGTATGVSFEFSSSLAAGHQCRLERGATVVADWAACSTGQSYDLSGPGDGDYTFRVRAVDDLGAAQPESTATYTLDRSPPPAPTFDSTPGTLGNDPTVAWAFTGEGGALLSCRLSRDGAVISGWSLCTSPDAHTLAGDGDYTFEVYATDMAGNPGAVAASTYELDTDDPAAPALTAGPTGPTNDATPTFAWTAEAGATFECRVDRGATQVIGWASCESGETPNLGLEADGAYTFRVRATDQAGNLGAVEGTRSFDLDRDPPPAPSITAGPSGHTSGDTPSWSFTGEAGAALECRIDRDAGATVVSDWAACVSPRSHDLTLQPDATYVFHVRARDAALNTGAEATRTIVLDRTAPAAPAVTSGPTTYSNDDTPLWAFAGEPGAAFACRVQRGATVIDDWGACTTPKGYDLSGHPDGTYTFRVRATDGAANTGADAAHTYTLDRSAPPAPAIVSGPSGPTNGQSPSWTFTAEAGAAASCRIERGATVVSNWAPCASPRSYDLSGQPDGTYTFRVRATDAADNTGADASQSIDLDRGAPAAPMISGWPAGSSSDAQPAVTFSHEAGAAATCRIERGATVVHDWQPCASPATYTFSSEPDGFYTFRVRATDAAGNVGAATSATYELDRVAPPSPTLSARPNPATNNSAVTYAFSATDATNFRCRVDRPGFVVSDWSNCSSPRSYDLSAQPDAVYTFHVRSVDAANNQSTETPDSFALDRSAPAAPAMTSGPSGPTNGSTPAFGFTAEGGAATACRIERGATVVSDWAPCVSPRSYDLTLEPDGGYTFRVRATDAAGNTGADGTRTFTLDRGAPVAPVVTSGPNGPSQDDAPSWSFTAEAGAATSCRVVRGATVVYDWAPCTSPQNVNLTAQVDGVYTFEVRATDAAGNTGSAASRTYTLDRTAPAAPAITDAPAADSNDDTPSWTFTAEAGSAAQCRVERGATVVHDWAPCASPHTPDLGAQVDGTYTFRVRATDPAGNTGAAASSTYRLDRGAPAAPSVTDGPTGPSQDDGPSFAFTAEAGAATACRIERGATVVSDWAACVSPRLYDLTLQPDGAYTFRVRATDAAQNTGAEGTRSYTLDRTEPVAPTITGGPSGPSPDAQPAWSYATEPGATTECRVVRGATEVVGWAPCTSPQGFDLRGEADGGYTFEVRATDAAGNLGDAAARAYTLDRTAPDAPSIDSGPAADSSDATPTFTFTGEAGAAITCRVERGATVVSNWAPCASPHTPDLSGEVDGAYTFRVRATDPAGNVGADAGRGYTLDRGAPAAPWFTAGPADPAKDDTPTFAWTAEPGAAAECRVERGATAVDDWAACSSEHTPDLTGEPDGTYDLLVRVTDAAGNTGAVARRGFRLDRTPPVAPSIDGAPASPTADGTPDWTFSGEAGATFECRLTRGATEVAAWAACASPRQYDLDGDDPDGAYAFHVRAIDAADNTGAAATSAIDVDRTEPTDTVLGAGPGADGNDRTPTWTFTGDGTGGFRCRMVSGATVVDDWAACASPKTYDLALHPDATYTIEMRGISTSGTLGPVLTDHYRLDTAAPGAPSIDSGPPALTYDDTPEWSFGGEPGARFECRVDRGATAVLAWAACSTPHTFDLRGEPNGTYDVSVRAIDAAGNVGPRTSASYELDRTAPATPTFTSEPPSRGSGRAPQWGFSGGGASFECRVERGATVLLDWGACTSPRRVDLAGEPDGVYTFSVRAVSAAGVKGDPATDGYDLDSGAPEPPTLTATPGPLGNGSRPAWAFTTEPGAALACRLERDGGIVVVDWAACSSPKDFDLAGEPDGVYLFSVRATDTAGNTGGVTAHEHRVDRLAPAPPTVDSAPPPVSSTRGPVWSFRAEDGAGIECRLEGPNGVVADWGPCTSPRTYDLSGQPDGSYTLLMRATDLAGNRGGETRSSFTLDATAPGLRIDSGPGALGRERDVAWTFSGDADAGFECRLVREAAEVVGWAPCASPGRYDLSGRPDGLYRFWLRARDAAGNPGQQIDAAYELDTTPPRDPEITERPESPGDDRTPTWRFTGEEQARFDCRVDRGGVAVLDWAPCRSPFTADLERSDDGEYRFAVRATDRAGNTGGTAAGRLTLQRKEEKEAPAPPARPEEDPRGDGEDAAAGTTRRPPADARPSVPRKPRGRLSKTPVVAPPVKRTQRPARPAPRPEPAPERGNAVSRALGAVADAARKAAGVVADHPDKSVFPGGLLLLVLGFLAIQGRLDRNDPKLALAPDFADPDLEFGPPPGIEP